MRRGVIMAGVLIAGIGAVMLLISLTVGIYEKAAYSLEIRKKQRE